MTILIDKKSYSKFEWFSKTFFHKFDKKLNSKVDFVRLRAKNITVIFCEVYKEFTNDTKNWKCELIFIKRNYYGILNQIWLVGPKFIFLRRELNTKYSKRRKLRKSFKNQYWNITKNWMILKQYHIFVSLYSVINTKVKCKKILRKLLYSRR